MKRILLILASAALGASLVAGGNAIASSDKGAETAPSAESTPAQAPNARLAVLINGESTPGTFSVLRAKGVLSVTNPSTGVFCVDPAVSMTLSRIVPDVSTTYDGTAGYDLFAQWNSGRPHCAPGTIEINTIDVSASSLFNDVQWTLTVS